MSLPLEKWDERFVRIAYEVASWSKDQRKRVGVVLVSPDKRKVSWGYNGPPAGMEVEANASKEAKNKLTIHAEVNAILNSTVDITGWSLYSTEPPCINCACTIVQKGLARIVFPKLNESSSWFAEQREALNILIRARINVVTFHQEEFKHGNRS